MSTYQSLITTEELSRLKLDVLQSVFDSVPFPRSDIILRFPDLPFILTQPEIFLVDETLKVSILVEQMNKTIKIVSEKNLNQHTDEEGKIIYFEFQSKQEEKNLLLTLEANVLSTSNSRIARLSSLQLKFQKRGNNWILMEDPTFSSA